MLRRIPLPIVISFFLLFLFVAAVAPPLRAVPGDRISVQIRHFGLDGAYTAAGPPWVEVAVRNTTDQALSFELRVAELNLDAGASASAGPCTIPMSLAAGEERLVNVPLNVYPPSNGSNNPATEVIYAEALDDHGVPIGRTGRVVPPLESGQIIAILCNTPGTCGATEQAILFGGSLGAGMVRAMHFRLIELTDAPAVGWAYDNAATVVVATAAAKLSSEQRDALELYMLRGGTLVLVENQLTAKRSRSGFLDAYRSRIPIGRISPAGAGHLIRFSSVASKYFSDYFGAREPAGVPGVPSTGRLKFTPGADNSRGMLTECLWLMKRLGTSFHFMSFIALLLWIVAYLILAGVVNFVILRRIGRPELGWITLPTVAVLFSVALYSYSVRTHPKNFVLDEMTVYQMEDRSPLAASWSHVRVSAPIQSGVRLAVSGDVGRAETDMGLAILRARDEDSDVANTPGRDFVGAFRMGKTWETQMSLRRWTFQGFDFEGDRRFAGSVHRDSNGMLHNDTGVDFRQAIVADEQYVYILDRFPSGAVVDLARVTREDYESATGRSTTQPGEYPPAPFSMPFGLRPTPSPKDQKRADDEFDAMQNQPFSLMELIRGWNPRGFIVFDQTKAVFFGLSDEAADSATLPDRAPDRKAHSLFIVTFGNWP